MTLLGQGAPGGTCGGMNFSSCKKGNERRCGRRHKDAQKETQERTEKQIQKKGNMWKEILLGMALGGRHAVLGGTSEGLWMWGTQTGAGTPLKGL